jgi:hypothetical protein
MKAAKILSRAGTAIPVAQIFKDCRAAVLVLFIGIAGDIAICRAQQPDSEVPGAQVLTRGPVHEAFAGIVTFNPQPGLVVTKAPPDLIEEVPPEERPEGDNVSWIPGYWAWDDERNDFLWVSGTWRALPPGRQWIAGYWGKTTQGYQWTSGYWADATAQETTYLPPPPATVEAGPNIVAPSVDYGWTPGCWLWYQGRYAWRPGYWAQGRADWDWIPAHYVWTPRGYLFVGGFWDYSVERRGVLFAPVYFESGVYSRRGYYYSPMITIELSVFSDHLFLRPRYHHYYFGDYYAPSYYQGGFYASFSFQSSRYGYDPFYSHQRWEHRSDREWEHRVEASYQYRRDHENARPPRTWAAQRNINPNTAESKQNRTLVAMPINQLAQRKDTAMRFQPVAKEERQKLAQRGQEVQKSRAQRQTLEAKPADTAARKPGGVLQPAKVQLPRSPIVAKPANQLGKNQAPPKAQRAPKPDLKLQPKPEPPGRQTTADRSNPQSEPRKPEAEKKSPPGRSEAEPRAMKAVPAPELRQASQQAEAPAPDQFKTESQKSKPVFSPATASPEAVRPATIKDPAGQSAGKFVAQPQPPSQASANKAQRVPAVRAKHEQIVSELGRPKMNKGQDKKVTGQQTPQAKLAVPPSSL